MKILKLFVCLLLILSTSLVNSLAAISVSDGSAFVTKAEFAADLNNLSNRMSSLENSLDAKIDSLVSSYLSRNGIWNGEKQAVSETKSWDIASPKITLDSNKASYGDVIDSSVIVSKTSKAGLFTGFLYFIDSDSSNYNSNDSRWGYDLNTMDPKYYFSDNGFTLFLSLEEIINNKNTTKFSYNIGSSMSMLTTTNKPTSCQMCIPLPSDKILVPVNFFVSKDSQIKLKVSLNLHGVNLQRIGALSRKIKVGIEDEFYIY